MELNRCKRCGSFFATSNNVCPNCQTRDIAEQTKLKDYLSENDYSGSIENLSINTGIAEKNLNRFLKEEDFKLYINKIEL